MFKFHEIPCQKLLRREFVLEDTTLLDDKIIGSAALVYQDKKIHVVDFFLKNYSYEMADLLAGGLLNVVCNTEVDGVVVPKEPHWERFGFDDKGDFLEAKLQQVTFDSFCKSRNCENCLDKCH